jgi:hypothetical protein
MGRPPSLPPFRRFPPDAIEADWNAKLRALTDAQRSCGEESQDDPGALNEEHRREILALAT